MYNYKQVYDKFYGERGAYHWTRDKARDQTVIIDRFIDNFGGLALEIGCGDGNVMGHLYRMGHKNFIGVDISPTALKLGKVEQEKRDIHIFTSAGNAVALPFNDGAFDIVIGADIIEHLTEEDGRLMLRECHRVLKCGGEIIVCTPNLRDEYKIDKSGLPIPIARMCPDVIKKVNFSEPGYHLHEYKRPELIKAVSRYFKVTHRAVGGTLGVMLKAKVSGGSVYKYSIRISNDKQFVRGVKT